MVVVMVVVVKNEDKEEIGALIIGSDAHQATI